MSVTSSRMDWELYIRSVIKSEIEDLLFLPEEFIPL